jgi:hypothetical protein
VREHLAHLLQESQAGGEERFTPLNFYRPQSESFQHQASIEAALREQPPATMNEAVTRCALAQGGAQALNIELLYLPTYSPNLNLIERFWKFVKQECL